MLLVFFAFDEDFSFETAEVVEAVTVTYYIRCIVSCKLHLVTFKLGKCTQGITAAMVKILSLSVQSERVCLRKM